MHIGAGFKIDSISTLFVMTEMGERATVCVCVYATKNSVGSLVQYSNNFTPQHQQHQEKEANSQPASNV